jgi:hypothetical protein
MLMIATRAVASPRRCVRVVVGSKRHAVVPIHVAEDREQAVRAIAESARATRKRPSRGMWIAAVLVGVACAIGFVVLMFSEGEPSPTPTRSTTDGRGFGFAAGLLVGGAVGIAVGLAIGRQRHSSRKSP